MVFVCGSQMFLEVRVGGGEKERKRKDTNKEPMGDIPDTATPATTRESEEMGALCSIFSFTNFLQV